MGPWLDMNGIAAYLQLGSDRAVRRLCTQTVRPLPYHRIGRLYRFHVAEVDAWIMQTGTGVQPAQKSGRFVRPLEA